MGMSMHIIIIVIACEIWLVGSLGLVAKGRLQFTNEPPLARALQLDQKWDSFAMARSSLSKCNAQGSDQDAGGFH